MAIRDFARVERGPEPIFNIVTADGKEAVLLNIRSQPDGSTLDIAKNLRRGLDALQQELPPDMKLAFLYDQSLIVGESVRSVWEAILFGLILSVAVLYLFLKNWGSTAVAALVIPVTVLMTLVAMKLTGLTFNLMTLGGIAAAIGVVIDDAIVVVETIHTKLSAGMKRAAAVQSAVGELLRRLVASTLTPVVVFIPLAFLDGITGVFFRALAMTMVVALLTSLVLGSAMTEIRERLSMDSSIPPGTIGFGGLYEQQQKSFQNLLIVLAMAIVLVFTVLLIEFRGLREPIAIVLGAVLALFGTVMALYLTGTSLNVVSFPGAIIGVGIVAKNGILMLDFVDHLQEQGLSADDALVRSGRRRLRPVLMTSLTTMLGMLPLAYGIGSGADMLRPLAIAVIGAVCISVLFSLIATPIFYRVLLAFRRIRVDVRSVCARHIGDLSSNSGVFRAEAADSCGLGAR